MQIFEFRIGKKIVQNTQKLVFVGNDTIIIMVHLNCVTLWFTQSLELLTTN